ncbi:MAG: glycosyltransferase [Clostridia bacterium]|nr:glycosyltransferase [Clostridia bacterium]
MLNLLKEIHQKYDVTLLSFFGNQEYQRDIPENVKVKILKSPFKHLGMSKKDTAGKPFLYLARAVWVFLTKAFGRSFVMRLMGLFQPRIKGYDCAISYLHEGPQKNLYGGCNEFVLRKVQALQKIAWLHCDFGLCGANNEQSRKIYARFDKIVACSEGCRRAFINCMPELAEKTASVRNCNDFEQIRELAKNAVTYEDGFLNIVTVARLSEEKGIERALAALAVCVAKGYRLRYHIVGSGDQESKLRNIVLEKSLTETVFFYGNQKNPYPYIANADLFLLPSYHEAAPVVFDEAACLGVPVLATQTTSTEEMIMQSGNGFVCENSDVGIQHGLEEILADPQKLNEVRQHIKEKEFGNQSIVGKFDALFA